MFRWSCILTLIRWSKEQRTRPLLLCVTKHWGVFLFLFFGDRIFSCVYHRRTSEPCHCAIMLIESCVTTLHDIIKCYFEGSALWEESQHFRTITKFNNLRPQWRNGVNIHQIVMFANAAGKWDRDWTEIENVYRVEADEEHKESKNKNRVRNSKGVVCEDYSATPKRRWESLGRRHVQIWVLLNARGTTDLGMEICREIFWEIRTDTAIIRNHDLLVSVQVCLSFCFNKNLTSFGTTAHNSMKNWRKLLSECYF